VAEIRFGLALHFHELHKLLGLPSDVLITSVTPNVAHDGKAMVGVCCAADDSRYDGVPHSASREPPYHLMSFFRPDIQTRTVSQVVIHPLKEK
jgi:hypothetical protein